MLDACWVLEHLPDPSTKGGAFLRPPQSGADFGRHRCVEPFVDWYGETGNPLMSFRDLFLFLVSSRQRAIGNWTDVPDVFGYQVFCLICIVYLLHSVSDGHITISILAAVRTDLGT